MGQRSDHRKRRKTKRIAVGVAVLFLLFLFWFNRMTKKQWEERQQRIAEGRQTSEKHQMTKMWSDLANLLPPITSATLKEYPHLVEVTPKAEVALKQCFKSLADQDPWTAQHYCEDAVMVAGNDPRAYIGRAYANLPRPTTKPSKDDFNTACRLGLPDACDWAQRLPDR